MSLLFKDGDTVHFVMASDGNLYLVADPEAAGIEGVDRGSATIERVDADTQTIWFKSPIPEGVKIP